MTDHSRRTKQTILLLGSLLDIQPAPATWTGNLVQRSTLPGPAPSRWQHCDTCQGAGTIADRFNRTAPCLQCAGHGRYKIDDYTGQRISTMENHLTAHQTTVRCDRCAGDGVWKFKRCELCEGSGRRVATGRELAATHEPNRKQTDLIWGRDGSYHELEHQLHDLRALSARAHLHLWRVHVDRTILLEHANRPLLDLSLDYVTARMPTPILVPAGLYTAEKRAATHRLKTKGRHTDPRARAARDSEIRKLRRRGKPVQWIAQQSGLSVSTIYEITAA